MVKTAEVIYKCYVCDTEQKEKKHYSKHLETSAVIICKKCNKLTSRRTQINDL